MSSDETVYLLWSVGALVLVVSALTARRMPASVLIRNVMGWIVIVVILFVLFSNREQIAMFAERIGLIDQEVDGDTVRIRQGSDGHFHANASINGIQVRMLIDSGATITALSEDTAKRAGIDASSGFPVTLDTANGTISARRGSIDRFAIGNLKTGDLGVVVSPAFGDTDVIGMNFLSKLASWRVEGTTLVLEPGRSALK